MTCGRVCSQLKIPYHEGTPGDWRSHVLFGPKGFIVRLPALVPKPRVNLTRLSEKHVFLVLLATYSC